MKAVWFGACVALLSACDSKSGKGTQPPGEPVGSNTEVEAGVPAGSGSTGVDASESLPTTYEAPVVGSSELFSNWPAGSAPNEVGARVAENFLSRLFRYEEMATQIILYRETIAWYGSLSLAAVTEDQALADRLIARFAPMLTPQRTAIPVGATVDDRVFGIVPLQIFMQTEDERYLDIGRGLADQQWMAPTADGITSEARYWIDDMFMITALQVQAFRATREAVYLDRAAATMASYLDRLQQPNGLFFHTLNSPIYWGRGNGWVAAGMAELLRSMPPEHPQHARILTGYREMMASLLEYQNSDGLWLQILDVPEAWPETSGSAMFAYAFVSGVKYGWLDEATYGARARSAWLGLVPYLDASGNLREVCTGTGEAFNEVGADPGAQRQYYLDRARTVGDYHGQAPLLWTASALLR